LVRIVVESTFDRPSDDFGWHRILRRIQPGFAAFWRRSRGLVAAKFGWIGAGLNLSGFIGLVADLSVPPFRTDSLPSRLDWGHDSNTARVNVAALPSGNQGLCARRGINPDNATIILV